MDCLKQKQFSTKCSICQQRETVSLLNCCIIFNCSQCLDQHTCESPLEAIPLHLKPQTQIQKQRFIQKSVKTCSRCSSEAIYHCRNCKGKLFCKGCSASIHTQKFSNHFLQSLNNKKQPIKQSTKYQSPVRKRISFFEKAPLQTKFSDSFTSSLSLNQSQYKESSFRSSSYILQTMELKLDAKMRQLKYLKQNISQKLEYYQSQVAITFGNIKTKLAIKQKELSVMIEQTFMHQIQVVQKMEKGLKISKNVFQTLSILQLMESKENCSLNIQMLMNSKKTKILQDIKRIDKKAQTMNLAEYKYAESGISHIATLISNLMPFQKVKAASTLRVIDSTSTINDKSEKSIRLSSKSISKNQISGLLKKSTPAMSIIGSKKSIFQSPRNSINSLNTSTKFIKKKHSNTFQNDIDRFLNQTTIKKRQGINPNIKMKSFFDSPKPNKAKQSRSGSKSGVGNKSQIKGVNLNGSFVATSPQKYKIWQR